MLLVMAAWAMGGRQCPSCGRQWNAGSTQWLGAVLGRQGEPGRVWSRRAGGMQGQRRLRHSLGQQAASRTGSRGRTRTLPGSAAGEPDAGEMRQTRRKGAALLSRWDSPEQGASNACVNPNLVAGGRVARPAGRACHPQRGLECGSAGRQAAPPTDPSAALVGPMLARAATAAVSAAGPAVPALFRPRPSVLRA